MAGAAMVLAFAGVALDEWVPQWLKLNWGVSVGVLIYFHHVSVSILIGSWAIRRRFWPPSTATALSLTS